MDFWLVRLLMVAALVVGIIGGVCSGYWLGGTGTSPGWLAAGVVLIIVSAMAEAWLYWELM